MDTLTLTLAVTGASTLPDVVPPPPPPLWTAAELPGIRGLWIPDTLGATVGASISSLPSSGGITNALTQASSGLQPTYQLFESTGKGALLFDGVDDCMAIPDKSIANAAEALVMFALVKFVSIDSSGSTKNLMNLRIGVSTGGKNRMMLGLGNQTSNKNWAVQYCPTDASSTVSQMTSAAAGLDAQLVVSQLIFNGSGSPKLDIWRNGTNIHSSVPAFTPAPLDSGDSYAAFVGGETSGPTVKINALIAQCGVVRGPISLSDRQKLEGALAWYGGIQASLPSDHPYKSAAPTL